MYASRMLVGFLTPLLLLATPTAQAQPEASTELLVFGPQREPLELLGWRLPPGPAVFDGGPVDFRVELRNAGPTQITATGTVQVDSWFANQGVSLHLPTEQLAPGQRGAIVTRWTDPPTAGLFTAHLDLETGSQPLFAEQHLMILPIPQVLAAVLVGIVVCLLLGRCLSLFFRGRGRARRLPDPAVISSSGALSRPTEQVVVSSAPKTGGGGDKSDDQEAPGPVVLLVDDDAALRGVLRYALRQHGFRTIEASSREEALEVIGSQVPDVILLDLAMPGLTGVETCRELREQSSAPVIVLTALDQDEELVSALETGADDFCTKPISLVGLAARIRVQLRRREALQQAVAAQTLATTAPEEQEPPATGDGTADYVPPAELLRRGQQAARAGDRRLAYDFFVQAAEQEPAIEQAWLWRAATSDDPQEAVRCLERVLQINPHNTRAREGLREVAERAALLQRPEGQD